MSGESPDPPAGPNSSLSSSPARCILPNLPHPAVAFASAHDVEAEAAHESAIGHFITAGDPSSPPSVVKSPPMDSGKSDISTAAHSFADDSYGDSVSAAGHSRVISEPQITDADRATEPQWRMRATALPPRVALRRRNAQQLGDRRRGDGSGEEKGVLRGRDKATGSGGGLRWWFHTCQWWFCDYSF
jgi:hypothetical protein